VAFSLETEDHADKVRGFRVSLQEWGGGREVAAVIERHDDPQAAYAQTNDLLGRRRTRATRAGWALK
jgi:hypothetical protein